MRDVVSDIFSSGNDLELTAPSDLVLSAYRSDRLTTAPAIPPGLSGVFPMRDFSASTLRSLARKGIHVIGTTVIPGAGDMPFATGERGYKLDDNGCLRIRSFAQVMALAS